MLFNKHFQLSLCGLVCLLMTSCITAWQLYDPAAHNVPLLADKHELNACGIAADHGLSGQMAYALTGHIGVMGAYQYETWNVNGADVYSSQHFSKTGELGAGYFEKFGLPDERGRFECYAGAGQGFVRDNVSNYHIPKRPESAALYYKAFIQPGIGYAMNNVEIAFSLRLSRVMFYRIASEEPSIDGRKFSFLSIDPAATVKFGYRNVKFVLQSGMNFPIGNDYKMINHRNFNEIINKLNLGLGLNIALFKKWKNSE
jgi:hypothetical protein